MSERKIHVKNDVPNGPDNCSNSSDRMGQLQQILYVIADSYLFK